MHQRTTGPADFHPSHMTQPVRRRWYVHCCVFILGEGSRYYRDRHQSSLMTVTTGLWSG